MLFLRFDYDENLEVKNKYRESSSVSEETSNQSKVPEFEQKSKKEIALRVGLELDNC